MSLKLASSNKKKLKEYQEMFPEITSVTIEDQKEIVADKDLVVFYKVKNINMPDVIIEDTIIEIEDDGAWKEVVDIKYTVRQLKKEQKANWVVTLGLLKDKTITLFRGNIQGRINPKTFEENTFGFDSIFYPENETRSLDTLNKLGIKSQFSARRLAMENLLNNAEYSSKHLSELPDWTGKYQS
jgi:inosine/xanthosine triphosphate pyrophosphatase family protein